MQKFSDWFLALGRQGLPPEAIGEVVLTALTTPRPKVRYAAVKGALANWIMPRLMPKRVVDRSMGKAVGLIP
jgi:hypothetical protein